MFETEDNGSVGDPFGFLDQGEHLWWYVKRRLHSYWFKVIYRNTLVEDGMLSEILFLNDVDQLQEISCVEPVIIEKVYIVSPGHLNGSDEWKMERLENIYHLYDPELEVSGYLFTLTNNDSYKYITDLVRKDAELTKTLVFSINKQKQKAPATNS